MTGQRDPVDSALDRLRSDSWTGRAYDPELENKLMQDFNHRSGATRSARPRILAIALALLLVSGASFAATGGIDTVKGWFVTIEMGDEIIDLTLDENGEATIRRETDDGGLTTVSVKKGTTPDGGETTRVSVKRTDGDGNHEECCEVVRNGSHTAPAAVDAAILADAEPAKAWSDEDGNTTEIYFLPVEEGEGTRIYLATTDPEGEQLVRHIGTPRINLADGEVAPKVELNDDGSLSITLDDGAGRVAEMKIKIAQGPMTEQLRPGNLEVQTPDGDVKVRVRPDKSRQ